MGTMKITTQILKRFIGRTNIYAKQLPHGAYMPQHNPITEETLQKHLDGKSVYGTYVIREDGLINYAVIDIDAKVGADLKPFLSMAEFVMTLFPEFERVLEFSGRRGYHIWLFTLTPEQPQFLRELIKTRMRNVGLRNIEIYPKQNRIDELKMKLGNLIKLPCGKHLRGTKSEILRWEHV